MKMTKKLSRSLVSVKKMELCPSLLNLYSDRYSLMFFLNDMLSGLKMFLLSLPIALALSFFCGASPVQGVVSSAVAAAVASILGGSKYQITSISIPLCVIVFEIVSRYQYKGLLCTAIFASAILILFGALQMSDVLKHGSYAFVSALSVYVLLSIISSQVQHILGVNTIQSSQSLLENFQLLKNNIGNVTEPGLMTAACFLLPLIVLKMFFRGFAPFLIYMSVGCVVAYLCKSGLFPWHVDLKTVGEEFISGGLVDNIFTISRNLPSQTVLSNTLSYGFVISIVIAVEACFCTNVSASITGDKRLQTNMELISSGISNMASVACGGLFVAPNINFSLKNISFGAKTVIPMLEIAIFSYLFILFHQTILQYIPISCISSILIVYSFFDLANRRIQRYLNLKTGDCYIFLITLAIVVYFGFVPAVIVGFTMSSITFSRRMILIKDAAVHTVKNHDIGAIEFMRNKNRFSTNQGIPIDILDKIEVIQVVNILSLNIVKVIDGALSVRGKFPSVLILYFRNIPFLDKEAFESIKEFVRNAASKGCIVMVTGTNGKLLDVLQQRAEKENEGDVFGYIVPNFDEAIRGAAKRMTKEVKA
jgi:SulP family sulfate permease